MPFFVNGVYGGNIMGIEMLVVGCIVFALWLLLARRWEHRCRAA